MLSPKTVRLPLAALASAIVALMVSSSVAGAGVRLDPTFAKQGRAVISPGQVSGAGSGVRIAPGPGDSFVVGTGSTVMRYLANGKRDRGFGGTGQVTIALPGRVGFSLSALAVDRQGRILVAGTTVLLPQGAPTDPQTLAAPVRAKATLFRFLPDGTPDPSFDGDGSLETDFGLAAPVDPTSGGSFREPVTRISDVAIDSQGRIVVLFNALTGYKECAPRGEVRSDLELVNNSYVARLMEQGGLDPTFGDGRGVFPGGNVGVQEEDGWLGLDPRDQPLFLSVGGFCSSAPIALGRLGVAGHLDAGFGGGGWRRVPKRHAEGVAMDASGRIFLLGPQEVDSAGRYDGVQVRRLLGDGKLDRQFGGMGRASLRLPKRSQISSLVADRQGGVWAVGVLNRSGGANGARRSSSFVLTGLDRSGKAQRGLGRLGAIVTGSPSGQLAGPVVGFVDSRGRVVVADEFTTSDRSSAGITLARFAFRR